MPKTSSVKLSAAFPAPAFDVEPYENDTAAFVEWVARKQIPRITSFPPPIARTMQQTFLVRFGADPVHVDDVEDILIPGPGGNIPARRYLAVEEPKAIVVFLHGGGWVLGDVAGYDAFCRQLAAATAAEVLSVDYRLAPENPFPAGLDDAFCALQWAAAHAGDLPVVVAGDSAGGNLAAALALRARDEGGPRIAQQVLLYPVLDHDLETNTYRLYGDGQLLSRDDMSWFLDHYVPDPKDRAHHLVSPLRAQNLQGLPPTYIAVGRCDPLFDEGREYAAGLKRAGVPVTFHDFPGLGHGFLSAPKAIPSTAHATTAVIDEITRHLAAIANDSIGTQEK